MLLACTALFLCVLFAVSGRPIPLVSIPDAVPVAASADTTSDAESDAAPVATSDAVSNPAPVATSDAVPDTAPVAASDAVSNPAPLATSDAVSDTAPVAASDAVSNPAPLATSDAGRVNINTADADALRALPGIGQTLAQRIIDYRDAHGAFTRPDELMNVSGIGQGRFSAVADLICV